MGFCLQGLPSVPPRPLSGSLPSCRCRPPRRTGRCARRRGRLQGLALGTGPFGRRPSRVGRRCPPGVLPSRASLPPSGRSAFVARPPLLPRRGPSSRPARAPGSRGSEGVAGPSPDPPALLGFVTLRLSRRVARRCRGRAHGFASGRSAARTAVPTLCAPWRSGWLPARAASPRPPSVGVRLAVSSVRQCRSEKEARRTAPRGESNLRASRPPPTPARRAPRRAPRPQTLARTRTAGSWRSPQYDGPSAGHAGTQPDCGMRGERRCNPRRKSDLGAGHARNIAWERAAPAPHRLAAPRPRAAGPTRRCEQAAPPPVTRSRTGSGRAPASCCRACAG